MVKTMGMRMKQYLTFKKAAAFLKFFIALSLFVAVSEMSLINSFSKLIVALLEFIIILELTRMLVDFLFSDDNRIKLRLMIDSTIVFFIRDIMLITNDKFDVLKIAFILGVILALFLLRILAMKYSPSKMEDALNG
jgi:uncharacterized membrane protein (DUF373 family)